MTSARISFPSVYHISLHENGILLSILHSLGKAVIHTEALQCYNQTDYGAQAMGARALRSIHYENDHR